MLFRAKYIHIKRVVIVILLTILAVGATNGIWLQEKPSKLRFDALGSGNVDFQLFYSKKLGFSEKESVYKNVNLSKVDKIAFDISVRKLGGLRLDFGSKPVEVAISNLVLKVGKKSVVPNLADVKFVNIEQHSLKNGVLTMKSSHHDPYIVIKLPKQMRCSYRIDWMILVVVLSLSYLFFNQVVGYLAGFKIKESHSRIDIVFVCFFFFLLFVPVSNIDKSEISKKENRSLAKYMPLTFEGRINQTYGKDFETWFNDRFWGRKNILKLYDKVDAMLNPTKGNDRVLVGRDGWLFYKASNGVRNYQNLDVFSDEDLKSVAEYLQGISDWCEKNDKKFVFLIGPDKSKIYPEFYGMVNKINPDDESRSTKLVNYLKNNTTVDVLYPYAQLHELKKQGDLLYWKTDTHWNKLGAYYVYLEFMKTLSPEKYAALQYVPEKMNLEKGYKGDLLNMYPSFTQKDETAYKVPLVKEQKCEKEQINKDTYNMFCSNLEGKHRLAVFRDSFSNALMPYWTNSFAKVSGFWNYDVMENAEFLKENADIVVLEMVERNLPMLKNYKLSRE